MLLVSVSSIVILSCKEDDDDVDDKESDTVESYLECPDSKHPHAIDLGIGVKWACCNVGASAPEQFGSYYAWGETEEKISYEFDTYKYFDSKTEECKDIGSDIAGTSYDVAHVRWGGGWRMPSRDQIRLLVENCSSEWTIISGVNGRVFTGPNGGKIFLPAAGFRWYDDIYTVGSYGNCWSSTQDPDSHFTSYALNFYSGNTTWSVSFSRNCGRSVRPVIE